jgi:hypothetical protein
MFEVIRDTLIGLLSWVLGSPTDDAASIARFVILIVFTVAATWLTFYWRDIAYRNPSIRRRLLPNDRYSGRYLQAVLHDGEVRYAIVHIYFNPEKKRHEVVGRTYLSDASDCSSFRSIYILFPSDKDNNIEFIWQGRQSLTANSFGGYTKMTILAPDEDYIEGDGLILDFGEEPKRYPLRFKHLDDAHVEDALGMRPPRSSAEEPDFVRRFHGLYGEAVRRGLNQISAQTAA